MKLTIEALESFGFKKYKPCVTIDKFDIGFSYFVEDEKGRKFNINVRFWDNTKYGMPNCFDTSVQFNKNGKTFNVQILRVCEMTPQEIVLWFDDMFDKMGCDYYD